MKKVKKAFSLIEVIFVLVILGIVASISSQIIIQVYENYIIQRALYNTTTKTELVATQIVNRLSYIINGTTIAKDITSLVAYTKASEYSALNLNGNWVKLEDIPTVDNNFTTIEWIGYDNDSFSAQATPSWSGIANYTTATRTNLPTPGSHLNDTGIIMNNLSKGKVDLVTTPAGLIFSQKANHYITGTEYDPSCMGLIDTAETACVFRVLRNGDTNLTFIDALPKIVTERYKLAWSAYALVPEMNADSLFNLYLYSNYQPWNGEAYTNGTKSLLMKNISVFKFTENGGVIQLKLCANENIGQSFNISSCKEKAIIR